MSPSKNFAQKTVILQSKSNTFAKINGKSSVILREQKKVNSAPLNTQSVLIDTCPVQIWEKATNTMNLYGSVHWGRIPKKFNKTLLGARSWNLISPPDGNCFLHSLLQFFHFPADHTQLLQDIVGLWGALSTESLTISGLFVDRLCKHFNIPSFTEESLLEVWSKGHLHLKDFSFGAIITKTIGNAGHVGFVTGKNMKRFPLQKLLDALSILAKKQDFACDEHIPNSLATKAQKKAKKQLGKHVDSAQESNLKKRFYAYRQFIGTSQQTLPSITPSLSNEGEWAYHLFCVNNQILSLPPKSIKSKRAYLIYSACCKTYHPEIWQKYELEHHITAAYKRIVQYGSNLKFSCNLPLISSNCTSSLDAGTIVGMYSRQANKPGKNVNVSPHLFVENKSASFKPTGYINKDVAKAMNSYGISNSSSSVHHSLQNGFLPSHDFIYDSLTCDLLNKMSLNIREMRLSCKQPLKADIYISSPNSASIVPILVQMLSINSFEDFFEIPTLLPHLSYWKAISLLFKQIISSSKEERSVQQDLILLAEFISQVPRAYTFVSLENGQPVQIDLSLDDVFVDFEDTIHAVYAQFRSSINIYVVIHQQMFENQSIFVPHNGYLLGGVNYLGKTSVTTKGEKRFKIAFADRCVPQFCDIFYHSNIDKMYCLDFEFSFIPGKYQMISGEGSFVIANGHGETKGTATILFRGSNRSLIRPLAHFANSGGRIDLGWYSVISFVTCTPCVNSVWAPPVATHKSLQATWMFQTLTNKSATPLKTLTQAARLWQDDIFSSSDLSIFQDSCKSFLDKYYPVRFFCPNAFRQEAAARLVSNLQNWSDIVCGKKWSSVNIKIQNSSYFGLLDSSVQYRNSMGNKPVQNPHWLWTALTSWNSPTVIDRDLRTLSQEQIDRVFFGARLKAVHIGKYKQVAQLIQTRKNLPLLSDNLAQNFSYALGKSPCQLSVSEFKSLQKMRMAVHKNRSVLCGTDSRASLLQSKVQYFFVKPISKQQITIPNPQIRLPESESSWEYIVQLTRSWLDEHPEPVEYSKLGLAQQNVASLITKTGWDVIKSDVKLSEFQWSSKSVHNAIYGVFGRQLSSNLRPSANHLQAFEHFCGTYWNSFSAEWSASDRQDLLSFDPWKWCAQKTQWTQGKRKKYLFQLDQQLTAGNQSQFIGTFRTMVKSGETYYTQSFDFNEWRFLIGQDSRPRNICVPSMTGCGWITAWQSTLWRDIKKIQQGFVQGLSKKQLQTLFRSNVPSTSWKSISLDGSSFDSTQYASLMRIVDNGFYDAIQAKEKQVLRQFVASMGGRVTITAERLWSLTKKSATKTNTILFTKIPQINGKPWPPHVIQAWNRDHLKQVFIEAGPQLFNNYLYFQIQGTTFSGHPTKTTKGNTFRSIMYARYYAQVAKVYDLRSQTQKVRFQRDLTSGAFRPNFHLFVQDLYRIFASGDDVVIFCQPSFCQRLTASILYCSSRTKSGTVGLGQCIKSVKVSQFWDIDFCSKWAFCDGTVQGWNLYRDVDKTLATKHFYINQNQQILNNPGLHSKALLLGLQSEHISALVQDFFRYRAFVYENQNTRKYSAQRLKQFCRKLQYPFQDDQTCYQNQQQINQRLGLSISDLFKLIDNDNIQFGSSLKQDLSIDFDLSFKYSFFFLLCLSDNQFISSISRQPNLKYATVELSVVSSIAASILSKAVLYGLSTALDLQNSQS